jgi:hypothetical protein
MQDENSKLDESREESTRKEIQKVMKLLNRPPVEHVPRHVKRRIPKKVYRKPVVPWDEPEEIINVP